MALSQGYVNEVLNHLPSTVVVDETVWPQLITQLHYEDRDLTSLIIGQMKLRMANGGYEGLMTNLAALLKENEELRKQLSQLTAPHPAPIPEPAPVSEPIPVYD